ncbi:MAG: peptide chain release factor N(5)-glutamine methyltransferase, partial [Oscillospiraceae bacterium]
EPLDVTVKNFAPRMALDGGEDGLAFYRAIAKNWKSALRLGGTLLFEVGYGQAGDVELILAQNGYENIKTYQDTGEIWRVVEATANT